VLDAYGGEGKITPSGIRQMSEFGAFFREYYEESLFKTNKLDDTKVWAKSTNEDRTILSSKAFYDAIFGRRNSIETTLGQGNLDNVFIKNFVFHSK
jgi:hypothetical protein